MFNPIIEIIFGILELALLYPLYRMLMLSFIAAYGILIWIGFKLGGVQKVAIFFGVSGSFSSWFYAASKGIDNCILSDFVGLCLVFAILQGIILSVIVFVLVWIGTLLIYKIYQKISKKEDKYKQKKVKHLNIYVFLAISLVLIQFLFWLKLLF